MKKYILTESQIRNLVSGFIDEERWKKGETIYTPEYLENIKEKYKGRLLQNFKKGEDSKVYSNVFRRGEDFYQDFIKDMVKTKRDSYTKDELRDIAKEYNSIAEFIGKGKGARHAAIRMGPFVTNPITGEKKNTYGFYNDITSHMTPLDNLSKRLVYVYEFYDENNTPLSAYIGLTYNSEKRKEQHIKGVDIYGKEKISAVTKFMRENPTYKNKYKELTDYIDANDAIKMEKYWEEKYFNDGWDILNVATTGSLGGRYNYSNKNLISKALECDTYRDLQKKYSSTIYSALRRRGLLQIVKDLFAQREQE
jgi:hypothetical protein